MVIANLQANAQLAQTILARASEQIAQTRPASPAHTALQHGLMTPKEFVPAETRSRLDLFTAPYWGAWETGAN